MLADDAKIRCAYYVLQHSRNALFIWKSMTY